MTGVQAPRLACSQGVRADPMFDVGFWELVLVGVVSLVVVGPERLPGFVRVVGFWMGKARRTAANVKQEIQDEFYAEELRKLSQHSSVDQISGLIEDSARALNDPASIGRTPARDFQNHGDAKDKPLESD